MKGGAAGGGVPSVFPLGGHSMGKLFKTIVWALVAMFVIFYLYTRPEAAAGFVKAVFGIFDSIERFFRTLVG